MYRDSQLVVFSRVRAQSPSGSLYLIAFVAAVSVVTESGSAFRGLSQKRLQLGEGLLDWIEIGTVRRQEQQLGAGRLDGLAHRVALVARQVVDHDDVARRERRHEHLCDVLQEARAVDRAVE